jgi:lipid-binding SYLF domain-containing protein
VRILLSALVAAAVSTCFLGCSTAPKTEEGRQVLVQDAQAAVDRMTADDPSLRDFMGRGVGYAIFPSVGKGGIGVGGAYGKGVVYEGGNVVGYADLSQASIGFQLGGQEYSELIVFENQNALDKFKTGEFEFAANASAVALKAGAAAGTNFKDNMAVFTRSNAGLMYEASIGGQKFTYLPADAAARQ